VNDFANLLSPAEEQALESRCRQLRERTGAQLAVVTLTSLRGGQIVDFANKLFSRWKIGQAGKNNGLLLLVAMEERDTRIEVGYGLEPIIPDMLAKRILDQQLRPRFREQQYAAGLTAAVDRLIELVERGEPADRKALAAEPPMSKSEVLFAIVFLTLFVAIGGVTLGFGLGSKFAQAIVSGLMFGGIHIAIGIGIAGPWGLLVHIPVLLTASFFGWQQAKNNKQLRRRRSTARPFDWGWGGFPSTGGGWTSGGGGGFSQSWGGFGGGSSGGGGASSGW
jgi:uncharacterized protein